MTFRGKANEEMLHDKSSESDMAEEAHLMLATLSAILVDLSESYYAIVDGAGGCLGGLFRLGELDLVVQDALAAYERQVLRRNMTYDIGVGGDDDGDMCYWVGLLSRRVEGRVRRRSSLLTDSITDWRPSANDSIVLSMHIHTGQHLQIIIGIKAEMLYNIFIGEMSCDVGYPTMSAV